MANIGDQLSNISLLILRTQVSCEREFRLRRQVLDGDRNAEQSTLLRTLDLDFKTLLHDAKHSKLPVSRGFDTHYSL
jgi:hypothetical protein